MYQEEVAVKLGEGGINCGLITPEAYGRGMDTLAHFATILHSHQPKQVLATGTAALRSAANGQDFIHEAKEKFNLNIQLISGEQEAEFIYRGVASAAQLSEQVLVMDIGGGSVEFIIGTGQKIVWRSSFPIGAARLEASFHHSDPIAEDDQQGIIQHLELELKTLRHQLNIHQPTLFIGSAGAFETYAALADRTAELEEKKLIRLPAIKFQEVLKNLIRSNKYSRDLDSRIPPVRKDMIVPAAVLTRYVIQLLETDQLAICAFALKEGLMASLLE